MVWAELGAAMPSSGGSLVYLREAYGHESYGRLMAFLFVWQFVLSGPLEIASGYIGFARYLGYIWTGLTPAPHRPRHARRPREHRAALPTHHVDREADGRALDRHDC